MRREGHYRILISFEIIGQDNVAKIEPRIVASMMSALHKRTGLGP